MLYLYISKEKDYRYHLKHNQIESHFSVDCNADTDLITKASNSKLLPDEAHDLRVDAFSKTKSLRNDAAPEHQLDVTISWQTPPNSSSLLIHQIIRHSSSFYFR